MNSFAYPTRSTICVLAAAVLTLSPHIKLSAGEPAPQLVMDEPVVIAVSRPGEKRWGYHQFPKISRLPGGEILVTYNASADDNAAYGHPGPALLSGDRGRTWKPYAGADVLAISHSPISALADGEFLCAPFPAGMDLGKIDDLPEPVGRYFCYADRLYYRLAECPKPVRDYTADILGYRWTPTMRSWQRETIRYDLTDALVWTSEQANGSILSRTSFEYPLSVSGKELFFADYKFRYAHPDGSIPRGMVVTCVASTDNGRTFERRGEIAFDPEGNEHPSETGLAETSDGRLVSVGRSTCEETRPMWVTFSADRGRTWTPRTKLFEFGVLPSLLLLKNDVLVLSFGRPGANLSFSVDGTGREWTDYTVLAADSCGYTGLLALSANEFLSRLQRLSTPQHGRRNLQGDPGAQDHRPAPRIVGAVICRWED